VSSDPAHEQPAPEPEPDEGNGEDEGAEPEAASAEQSAAGGEGSEHEGAEPAPVPCPLCEGKGELLIAPRQSPSWKRCDDCDGWGQVLTGSHLPEAAMIDCERCSGKGYAPRPMPVPTYVSPDTPGAEYDAASGTWVVRNPPLAAPQY